MPRLRAAGQITAEAQVNERQRTPVLDAAAAARSPSYTLRVESVTCQGALALAILFAAFVVDCEELTN